MVTQITLAKFLELYEARQIEEPVTVKVGDEQRIYARTICGAIMGDKARAVYAVV